MDKETPIEIARNKKQLGYFLTGGLIFFLFGLLLVIDPALFKPERLPSNFIIVATGASIMVASGIYSYIMAVRIASVFPGMIISTRDIYDHTGSPGDGLINWADIVEFRETLIRGGKFLTIVVRNPEAYIERQRNPVKRQLLVRMTASYGSPIQVAAKDLDIEFESLKTILREHLDKFRQSSPVK
jgi:hypothetical protein